MKSVFYNALLEILISLESVEKLMYFILLQ